MSQIQSENDDDNCYVVASDFVQLSQPDEMPDQEAEEQQHDPLDWVIDMESTTIKELKFMMANLEAKNQMLQGKVEILELKAENRALNFKKNAEQNNDNFQHPKTKGIPYDVQLVKADNETYFGLKIVKSENHHFITAIEPGSAAMRTGRLHAWDCFIAINGTRVDSMTHQEVVQFVRAAGNRLTITIDPKHRMENDVGLSGDNLFLWDSSASSGSGGIANNYSRLGAKSHIAAVNEAEEIYDPWKFQRESAWMRLVWVPYILLAILCGMQLYDSFFPANSPNQAPMAEQNNAAYFHKQIGQFRAKLVHVDVVDNLNALLKSQNETIAEFRAKTEQQAKEIDQMIKEGNAHKDLEKLHIQTIEALRAKIDNIDKEHSRTIGQKSVDAGEDEKKNNGQKAETVDRVCIGDRKRTIIVTFLFSALISTSIFLAVLCIYALIKLGLA